MLVLGELKCNADEVVPRTPIRKDGTFATSRYAQNVGAHYDLRGTLEHASLHSLVHTSPVIE